jgi:hypothetical protein
MGMAKKFFGLIVTEITTIFFALVSLLETNKYNKSKNKY